MPRHNPRRRYDASRRQAAAGRRRFAVVEAARRAFEERGWAGTRMRDVSEAAGVSQKLVEAVFRNKAGLLQAAVDYAIRGDVAPVPMRERPMVLAMEAAKDAPEMLRLHALHLRAINSRSARIAWVVEQAAAADAAVDELWRQMNENRSFGVRWATDTLFRKPGRKRRLTRKHAATAFWVALDWATYRTLTLHAGLDDAGYQHWLERYYAATLLP